MTGRRRHVPLRRCVACRASLPKADLVRLVRTEAGWQLDATGRAGGRGTWLCHACLERLDERTTVRALTRTFRHDTAHVSALLRPLRAARAATATDAATAAPLAVTPSEDSRHGGTHG